MYIRYHYLALVSISERRMTADGRRNYHHVGGGSGLIPSLSTINWCWGFLSGLSSLRTRVHITAWNIRVMDADRYLMKWGN